MPGKTTISWTDKSWNPTVGCTRVSAGCDHCYAFTMHEKRRAALLGGTGAGLPKQYERPFDEMQLFPDRLEVPLRWKVPARIFVNSISDLFHPDVPDEFVAEVFAVMSVAHWHTFQVLTKRPRRMRMLLNSPYFESRVKHNAYLRINVERMMARGILPAFPTWPLRNVWLGVSVENEAAAYRLEYLVDTPAAVRFVSAEPLLGPLDLSGWITTSCPHHSAKAEGTKGDCWRCDGCGEVYCYESDPRGTISVGRGYPRQRRDVITPGRAGIDWVIVGGESGPGFRPMQMDWAEDIHRQCSDAGTAFWFKQDSGFTSGHQGRASDELWNAKAFPANHQQLVSQPVVQTTPYRRLTVYRLREDGTEATIYSCVYNNLGVELPPEVRGLMNQPGIRAEVKEVEPNT